MYFPKINNYLQTYLVCTVFLLLWNPMTASSFPQNSGESVTVEKNKASNITMQTVSGKVLRTMNSGGYTYALVDDDGVKTWVALPKSTLAVGNEITCQPGMVMNNFSSRSLNQTFKHIVFSRGITSISQGTASQTENQAPVEEPDLPKVKDSEDWGDFFNKSQPDE